MSDRANQVAHRAALVLFAQADNPIAPGETGVWFDGTDITFVDALGNLTVLGDAFAYGTTGSMVPISGTSDAGVLNATARIDHDHELDTGVVDSAQLAADAVDGPALSASSLRLLAFAGVAAAGPATATGVKVGDTVVGVIDIAAASVSAAASFESTITVNDEIQQSSASDLSLKKYALLVVAKS